MKALILILTLVSGLTSSLKAEVYKTGEHKSATASSLSVEQEMELLQDYFSDLNNEESESVSIQIFDSNFELIIEGQINPMEEIENEELNKYMQSSNYLMTIGDKTLYMLE